MSFLGIVMITSALFERGDIISDIEENFFSFL